MNGSVLVASYIRGASGCSHSSDISVVSPGRIAIWSTSGTRSSGQPAWAAIRSVLSVRSTSITEAASANATDSAASAVACATWARSRVSSRARANPSSTSATW